MRFKPRIESQVFVVAVLLLAALATTWARFFFRMTQENYELKARLLLFEKPDEHVARLQEVATEHARRTLQVVGEGSLFFVLLMLCVGLLFMVAREAKRAKERMDNMLAMTTHELKTPIAGVKALLQSLQIGSVPKDLEAKLLESGLHECQRLEHLAETILAYQRAIVSNEREVAAHSSKALLTTILEHRGAFDVKHLDIQLGEDGLVLADEDSLRVIVENLLDNADKYGGGEVALRCEVQASTWSLTVSDRGIGFAPAQAHALFEPFTRGEKTGGKHGSGLGLYIAKSLAERMGGTLSASSGGLGQGASFTLTLRRV